MNLPELPSESQIANWLQSFQQQLGKYFRIAWCSLISPTSLIFNSLYDQSKNKVEKLIAPITFVLLTLVVASLIGTVVDVIFGVDKPFFNHFSYYAGYKSYGYWLAAIQKILPDWFSASLVLRSLKFAVILMVVIFWARSLVPNKRRYWSDFAAFLYLLPIVLIAEITLYCVVNITYRIIGENILLFYSAISIISILSAVIIYGIVLRVLDRIYFSRVRRRVIFIIGYLIAVPVLLTAQNISFYFAPVGFQAYAAIKPTLKGDAQLNKGEYEAAEKLYVQAIKNDVTGVWSSHAHIMLVSAKARRILALLPDIVSDSGVYKRLSHKFAQEDPLRQVVNAFRLKGSASVTRAHLIEYRELILSHFLTGGDIPVTDSELDCALRPTAADENCDDLPKESITGKPDNQAQRQRLYYLIYRSRALRGEPTMEDSTRYLQFLLALPTRIEIMFVRYHALNLARDSETLAYIDDRYKIGGLDREAIIRGFSEIQEHGYKLTYLMISNGEIKKLSDQELGFHLRQVYLNYLKAEARLLSASSLSDESSIIRQNAVSIEEQLSWVEKDARYANINP